jgi:integrase
VSNLGLGRPVAGRAVGAGRSRRKRAPGAHRGYSGVGEAGNQRLDDRRGHRRRQVAPRRVEGRQGQREHERLRRLVGGRAIFRGNRDRAVRGARPRRTCAKLCRKKGGNIEQIKLLLGHSSIQTTERYLGSEQEIEIAVNDNLGLQSEKLH